MKIYRFGIRGWFGAVLAACATVAATLPLNPATASEPSAWEFIECSEGSLNVRVDTATRAVTGSANVSSCVSQGTPGYTSATITIRGSATQITASLVDTVTTETIRWNTGQTTTVSVQRSFMGATNLSAIGIGKTTAGLFHPADQFDSGDGNRSNGAGAITLSKETSWMVGSM
ncbi:MAG TPA: hypothetical protein VGX25_09000 [Actinophytocola sp.]|uniref:hypothetical protein n=1 Tax=Actinophytocola sp. TaxID=1872138 RepID=UPI002DDCC47F|nr:hypothetical protein [Actinophytocola sp.]HEV2779525.1 hypothetical protein [Actinophytocola sp.]